MFMITGLQMQAYRATSDAKYSNLAASTMVDYLNRLQQSDGTFYHHENVLTYLVNAGSKLYDSEQDYTGLGAIHPNSPYAIYISTTTDPRDDTKTFRYHEIWRGTTCDEGATFTWTPITENSSEENLRPIVPYWDSDRTVLLWTRGSYASAQTYNTSIVGLVMDGR